MSGSLGNKRTMANNIKRFMDEKGVTRRDLCDKLGFKYSTVTDWINAEKYPRIDKIEAMANFFGVSKADLVEPLPAPPAEEPRRKGVLDLTDKEARHMQLYRTLDDEGRAVVDSVTETYAEKARDAETSSDLTGIDKRA